MRNGLLFFLLSVYCSTVFAIPADIIYGDGDQKDNKGNKAISDYDSLLVDPLNLKDKYFWLYRKLIEAKDRVELPNRSERTFVPHLRDSRDFFPLPERIYRIQYNKNGHDTVEGSLKYVVVFPRKYRYSVTKTDDSYTITVNVHFINATSDEVKKLDLLFMLAEDYWNKHRYDFGVEYQFKFNVVLDSRLAHFKVYLEDNTRGPYDKRWDRKWSYRTVAHELGHMMGVGDEYRTLSSKIDCLTKSLMCVSTGKPQKQHYYHILRRLLEY